MAVRRRITGKQALRDVDVLCSRHGRRGRFVEDYGFVDEDILVTLFVPADETYSGIRQKLEQHLGIRTVRHNWGIDGPDGSDKIMDDEQRLDVYDIFEKGGYMRFVYLEGNMNITLLKLNGETFTVGVDRSALIAHTVDVIAWALGLNTATSTVDVNLVFDGRVLDWDATLAECNVRDGDELNVILQAQA